MPGGQPPVPDATGDRPAPLVADGALAILDSVLDAVLGVDAEGRIVFANSHTERIFGHHPSDLIGQLVEVLIPAASRIRHRELRGRFCTNPAPRPMGGGMGLPALRKDGSTFLAEVSLASMQTPNGMVVTAVVRDLTQHPRRRDADRAPTTSEPAGPGGDEQVRPAFDDAPIGMLMISARPDRLDRIIGVNRAFRRLAGRSEDELLDQLSLDVLRPNDRQQAEQLRGRVLAGEVTTVDQVERRIQHANGHEIWVSMTESLVRDEQGEPNYFFVSQVLDITERRENARAAARLTEREHRIATVLQKELLPNVPSRVGGIRTASRYQPAGDGEAVGGDWHDVFPLPGGRIGLSIGDVAGHGIELAATMSRLRYAVRMLAATGADPATVVTRLNEVQFDPDRPWAEIEIATVVHAQIDLATGGMTSCSAGHLPLIILSSGGPAAGTVRLPACPIPALGGPPVGVLPGLHYQQHQTRLEPGDVLIGYTDGLIERRGQSLDEGMLTLLTGLNAVTGEVLGDLDALADEVLRLAPPGPWADDTAVLVLALPAGPKAPLVDQDVADQDAVHAS